MLLYYDGICFIGNLVIFVVLKEMRKCVKIRQIILILTS